MNDKTVMNKLHIQFMCDCYHLPYCNNTKDFVYWLGKTKFEIFVYAVKTNDIRLVLNYCSDLFITELQNIPFGLENRKIDIFLLEKEYNFLLKFLVKKGLKVCDEAITYFVKNNDADIIIDILENHPKTGIFIYNEAMKYNVIDIVALFVKNKINNNNNVMPAIIINV